MVWSFPEMKGFFLLALAAVMLQPPVSRFQRLTFRASDGTKLLYGRAIPEDYDPRRPRPLVVALHPGGQRTPFYGDQYMRQIYLPGLADLDPIMVAPDCPTPAWSDPAADQAVMALIDNVMAEYAIDRRRVLVTGFSLGGSGTWFMSAHHPDRFTAAVVLAGRTDESLEQLAKIPTYIIHSRDDEIVPFAQAEQRAAGLSALGRVVKFEALQGLGHYAMRGYVGALQRAGRWVAERWEK
jgi:predicted peptidase